ncbi:MAG TPA: hypothetical protein VNV88_02725 [Candidatus Solibacter sp.]|nr:hypothetical protein [Candidatus Solibacter sp.]
MTRQFKFDPELKIIAESNGKPLILNDLEADLGRELREPGFEREGILMVKMLIQVR